MGVESYNFSSFQPPLTSVIPVTRLKLFIYNFYYKKKQSVQVNFTGLVLFFFYDLPAQKVIMSSVTFSGRRSLVRFSIAANNHSAEIKVEI